MPATLAPATRHSVICGICDVEATCLTEMIVRNLTWNPYLGTQVVEASIALALPVGWVLRDFVHEVCFLCPTCSLDQPAERDRSSLNA